MVAAALSLPVAIVALLIGQPTSSLGFGRSAGLRSAVGGAVLGLASVLLGGYSI